ncbi:MAG: efflux RND transporter permease subunit [Geminicoccaceae bacterium]
MTAPTDSEHPVSRGNVSAWAVAHPALVLFLIIVFSAAGLVSYFNLGRAEDPSFAIKTMVISAAWPGATAEEMQDQVADKLEKRLQELELFDYVRTYTRPGVTVIQVQLKDTARQKEVDDSWYQVRKKLNDARPTLPQGVQGPFFNDEYGDVYSAIYMLSGSDVSLAKLKDYAEIVRQRILRTEGVAKVDIVGVRNQRIFIEFSHRKLATLGITPQTIFESVARQNAVTAAGTVETSADRIDIRVTGAFKGEAAIAEVPIEAGGTTFRLGDIATIKRGYEDPPASIVRHNGSEAVGVVVAMTKGANVLELGQRLEEAIADAKTQVPTGVEIDQITDQPRVVEESVSEFLRSFVEALGIVLVVSFISLGWRSGLVVATSVPLVLAVVLVVMNVAGLNLDRITLGSLIIALGLLVDDAIIAVEMMVVKMEQGWSRIRAAAFAWDSTAFPMLTGTLVTAAGFLPVGIARSTAGEYAGNIFWIVGLALVVSWIVAVFFTPYIGVKLLPNFAKHGSAHAAHDIYDTRLYRLLRRLVGWSVRFRWVVIALTLGAFVSAIAAFTQVQQQFFPTSSRPELFIEIRMPEGTSIGVTEAAAKQAEALIKGDPDLEYYTTYVGEGSPRFFLALNPVLPNENFALIVMMTKGAEARERLKDRLEKLVAENVIPEARLRIDRLNFGPPVGFPVQFRVMGPDGDSVRNVADKVRTAMRANPNTRDVQFDWNEQKKSIRLEVDQDRARSLGLTPQDISETMGTLLSGYTVTEYKEGIELVPVVARAIPEERLGLGSFEDLTIPTRSGAAVPISQVARVHYEFEDPILWRRNRDVVLTVRSDIAPGMQAPDVTVQIQPAIDEIAATLPPGMRIEVGGAVEESAKANAALFKIFPLMFLAMLTILMLQLHSFSTLFLVFSTAPLGLIGASFSLLAFDAPFGFNALLGLIALAGMIMRNTVILVDQIDADVASGLSRWDAIIESTVRRSRPLVLTALAAILAMIPLSRSVFWGPMAITMMGGLLVATILTLLFLPALYAAWFRVRRPKSEQVAMLPQLQASPGSSPMIAAQV